MKHTAPTAYSAPQVTLHEVAVELGFAKSPGGSIDDLPVVDWSAPSPFTCDDE